MLKKMTYHYFPKDPVNEVHRSFRIFCENGDYFVSVTDEVTKRINIFRFALSGEFMDTHPETIVALGELHRAFEKEAKSEKNPMIKCPECSVEFSEGDTLAQKKHMKENHPEVVVKRLREAGMHMSANKFAKERGISPQVQK